MKAFGCLVALALASTLSCSRRKDPPAPAPSASGSAAAPATCAPCEARQVCVSGQCVYDSIDYQVDQLALAPTFACALYANGDVWCAGKTAPARVTGIDGKASDIAAAGDRACAIADGGGVFCWANDANAAKRVAGVEGARRVAASAKRACATIWGKDAGTVACWGADLVARTVNGVDAYGRVAVGDGRSCAIDGRTIRCWSGDGPATKVPDVDDAFYVAQSDHALCYIDTHDHDVHCRGGAFGAQFSKVAYLARAPLLVTGSDIVCAIVPGKEIRCTDGKDRYAVTLGDGGAHTQARLLAASGAYTINVHANDDVVDADDDLPTKSNLDRLGQFGPTADAAQIRFAKGISR